MERACHCAAADTWLQYFGPNLPAADWAVKAVFVTEKREIVTSFSDSAGKFKCGIIVTKARN